MFKVHTNYEIGHESTFGYIPLKVVAIRQDSEGYNEYLLSDGMWYTGWMMITWKD